MATGLLNNGKFFCNSQICKKKSMAYDWYILLLIGLDFDRGNCI